MLITPLFAKAQSLILPSLDNVVHLVQCSPDARHVIANTEDNIVGVWDMANGNLIHSLVHDETAYDAKYDASGKYILTYSYGMGFSPIYEGASLWDAKTGNLLHKFEDHSSSITSMDFSPDSEKIITGSRDSTAKIWNTSTGELIHSLEDHNGTIECVKFSPDGKIIITTSSDKTAKIWDSNKGILLHSLEDHTDKVTYAEIHPNGKTLLTASSDNSVKVWEVETGNYIQTLKGHPENVTFIAFSPDEKYLLTLASDIAVVNNTIILWDARSLKQIHRIEGNILDDSAVGHRRFISAAIFSNNSKRLITSSFDETIKIWDTDNGKLIKNIYHYSPDLSFHITENRFLAAARNGFLLIGAESGKEIIQLNTVDDNPEKWIHLYKGKYIDTHEDVMSRIIVREGGQSFPFSNYKEDYYVPGLWSKVMMDDTSFVKK